MGMDNLLSQQRPRKRRNRPFRVRSRRHTCFSYFVSLFKRLSDSAGSFIKGIKLKPGNISVVVISVLALSAIWIVAYSVSAPETPPTGITASLLNNTEQKNLAGQTEQILKVAAPVSMEDDNTGSGVEVLDRSEDNSYIIRPGETLSEIAYSYDVNFRVLATYNQITDPNLIRPGMSILIPSIANEKKTAQKLASVPVVNTVTTTAAKKVTITAEKTDNGNGITVHFRILDPSPDTLREFEWDLGDGRKAFRPDPSYEYSKPRTYAIKLTARDAKGTTYKSPVLYIDVPHPNASAHENRIRFNILSSPDEHFIINGSILRIARYKSIEEAPVEIVEADDVFTKVSFKKPGYYGITTLLHDGEERFESVFVSPVPSIHADREDLNWYRTQYNTGTTSNCGPSSASMAIGWVTGTYVPVSTIRQSVGWTGEGGVSFEEILKVVRHHGINASVQPLRTPQDLRDLIDDGNIAIILFHTSGVSMTSRRPETDLFGKYYNDNVGHYIVVKGYSLDGKYFVVYDPIPSDWSGNILRYADEVSMIGRNRYYSVEGIMNSLRRRDMIAVTKPVK